MTNSPQLEPESSHDDSPRRRLWIRVGLFFGAIAVLVATGGALWAWIFVHERLSPRISQILSDLLDRPIQLGEVERVTLSSIRFGPSAAPATETDPDELFVESIVVKFNLLEALLTQDLNLQLELNEVRGYLEQNATRQWTDLELPEREERLIEIKLTRVSVAEGQLVLVPYNELDAGDDLISLEEIAGVVEFSAYQLPKQEGQEIAIEPQEISFEVAAQPTVGGQLDVKGSFLQLPEGVETEEFAAGVNTNIAVNAQEVRIADFAPLAFSFVRSPLPLEIQAGTVSGSVDIEVRPEAPLKLQGAAEITDGGVALEALPNPIEAIDSQLRFDGSEITLEDTRARYGEIAATAAGVIDLQQGYDLEGSIASFTVDQVVDTFAVDLPIEAEGAFTADVAVTGPLDDPNVTGTIASLGSTLIDRVSFTELGLAFSFDRPVLTISQFQALPTAGGRLVGRGRYRLGEVGELFLQAEGQALPADAIGQAYGLPETVQLGRLAVDAEVTGPINNLRGFVNWQAPGASYPSRGAIEFAGDRINFSDTVVQVAGGTVSGSGTLANRLWQANLRGQGIQLGQFNDTLAGTADGDFLLSGSLDDFSLAGIRAQGEAALQLAAGRLNVDATLANGFWNADLSSRGLALSQFSPNLQGNASGQAQLSGSLDDLSLAGIRGQGDIAVQLDSGRLNAVTRLANGLWSADVRSSGLALSQFSAALRGNASGQLQLSGNVNDFSLAGIQAQGDVALSQGLASFAAYSPQLAELSQPLSATLSWDGRQINIAQASGAGLQASGTITPRLSGANAPAIASIDLNLQTNDYPLQALPLNLPSVVALAGRADFRGRLSGTPSNLNLVGDLALSDFVVNELAFDPRLVGEVSLTNSNQFNLTLLGPEDEIQVDYRLSDRNLNFTVALDEASAVGQTTADNLLRVEIENFPLLALNLPPGGVANIGQVSGRIDEALLTIDLQAQEFVAELNIDRPGLGYITADRFTGRVSYQDGVAQLTAGRLIRGESEYQLTGRYAPGATPTLLADLQVTQGRLQDILAALQITDLADLRRGFRAPLGVELSPEEVERLLATQPAGSANATLLRQIQRLSEIQALQDIAVAEAAAAPFPPLSELEGAFTGDIRLASSAQTGLEVDFDLTGSNWRWGSDYAADEVIAEGSYGDGILTLEPISLRSTTENIFLSLVGDVALRQADAERRTLSLTAENLPVSRLRRLVRRLPVSLDGKLNANASLTGSLQNPQLRGSVTLDQGTINNRSIESAQADFIYNEARFNVISRVVVEEPDPLIVTASFPLRYPGLVIEPASDRFEASAEVNDEGLALLNLFTRQVTWEEGEGEVQFDAVGFWPAYSSFPLITSLTGQAQVENATLTSILLPNETLTNFSALANFQGEQIIVQNLSGNLSNGQVSGQGIFPLLAPITTDPDVEDLQADQPAVEQPLTLQLEQIALNFKGLYNGNVAGTLVLGGSAFAPLIGGQVVLSDGRVFLPEGQGAATPDSTASAQATTLVSPPQLSDLEL
ncbi:translocation/assembly module TamB domain-containing protein, partial [Almyronema epifaneia]